MSNRLRPVDDAAYRAVVDADRESAHWRARISYGEVPHAAICAGTMLDQEHVLTCVHAILDIAGLPEGASVEQAGDISFTVALVNLADQPQAQARVTGRFWAPVTAGGGGDIAVLELRAPLSRARPAPLHRSDLYQHQDVRTCGFPAGVDTGYWVTTEFAGRCGPGGIWMQLASERIAAGFSGAAVIDEANRVVGMCVAKAKGSRLENAYMIPVEAMPGVLPELRQWIRGPRAVDESFTRSAHSDPGSHATARQVVGWLARAGAGEIDLICTGTADSAAGLRNSVVLADRERPPSVREILAETPADAVPAVGSVDLAIDASGQAAEQVRARILERLGIDVAVPESQPRRHNRPRTVVVTAIDGAADPARLVREVLLPLVQNARRWELRLILGFHEETAEIRALRAAIDDVPGLLAGLERDIADLRVAEAGAAELHDHLTERVTGLPDVPRAAALHDSALELLRAESGEPAWVRSHIGDCRSAVERDLRAVQEIREQLQLARDRRSELRGALTSYRQVIPEQGPELEVLYQAANHELWEKRCDLKVAAKLVEDYVRAVMERVAERPELA